MKLGSILPVAGQEASVVKIYVFPEIAYKPPSQWPLGLGFGRHLVEMKPIDALHLPI